MALFENYIYIEKCIFFKNKNIKIETFDEFV